MTRIRTVLLTSGLLLTVYGGAALAQSDAPAAASGAGRKPMVTLQMPALPDLVKVAVNPATTAVLVSDIVDPICKSQPKCTGTMVPAIASLLAQARKAGVLVVYATRQPTISKWLQEVTPAAGDPVIASHAQDRFYNTDLDKTLRAKGITTLILTGRSAAPWLIRQWAQRCGIIPSSYQSTRAWPGRISKRPSAFQILNQSSANPTNEPLKPKASTLSRSDLINFQ